MDNRVTRFAIAVIACAGIIASAAGMAAAAVSPDEQTTMLSLHNTLRESTAASETQRLGQTVTIPDLTWDPAAAAVAQAWADNLLATNTFEHNANRGPYGENIYWESGSDPATSAAGAFQSWAAEAASYTWDTDTCTDQCGHYTQIVWAATSSVGCGMATDGSKAIWVCDYAPPGNFTGQRPYEPGVSPAGSPATGSPMVASPAAGSPAIDTPSPTDTPLPTDTPSPTDTPLPTDTPAA